VGTPTSYIGTINEMLWVMAFFWSETQLGLRIPKVAKVSGLR
jgi:hypothetical protein